MGSTGLRVNALERALRSRNRLLEEERPDEAWLDAWWSVDGRGGSAELDAARRILERFLDG